MKYGYVYTTPDLMGLPVVRQLHDSRVQVLLDEALKTGARFEGEPAPAPTPAPESAPAPTPPAAPTPTPPPIPTPTPTPDSPRDAPASADGEDNSKLKKALEAERAARKEADQRAKTAGEEAAARATAAEERYQQTMDKLSRALGFKSEDTPPDPAALQRTIAERDNELGDVKSRVEAVTAEKDAQIRELNVELAAWRAASRQGANVPALLDSRTFLQSVSAMDPAGESFAADLDEAVKSALAANVSLRAIPPVSSPDQAGIGTAGAKTVNVAPGTARIRAGYSS